MSNLTQYKIFIGDDKNNTPFGVAFSFKLQVYTNPTCKDVWNTVFVSSSG